MQILRQQTIQFIANIRRPARLSSSNPIASKRLVHRTSHQLFRRPDVSPPIAHHVRHRHHRVESLFERQRPIEQCSQLQDHRVYSEVCGEVQSSVKRTLGDHFAEKESNSPMRTFQEKTRSRCMSTLESNTCFLSSPLTLVFIQCDNAVCHLWNLALPLQLKKTNLPMGRISASTTSNLRIPLPAR